MSTKTVTMTCRDINGGVVNITQDYDRDCTWSAIAYQFSCLLRGMGYHLETEAVGADVEKFIAATEKTEGDW